MKKIYMTALSLLVTAKVFALADLVVTLGGFSPMSISKCENLTVTATVKNSGNVVAPKSTVFLTIAQNATFSDISYLSQTKVKQLNPNESVVVEFIYPIASTYSASRYYVGIYVDAYGEVVESDEANLYPLSGTLSLANTLTASLKIPYPIIFIHGLASDSDTWNTLTDNIDKTYGWTFGGRMDFCLNADGNKYTANFATDYKDFTALQNNLSVADYYYVNFSVSAAGVFGPNTYTSQSNQSAIFKQGRAVRDAIKYVRQKTGADKVILVGHSMGGLASREYLQNPAVWQSDAQHHVAKLFTVGTPHGGSNSTASVLSTVSAGLDESSEAVRDLRYNNLIYVGRYLFGGTETTSSGFYNGDINCNGVTGDAIVGLQDKTIPTNIFYTCMIGTGAFTGGDGIVAESRANINTYPSIPGVVADTFLDRTYATIETHTKLPQNIRENIKGLDEPYAYNLAYGISLNKLYYGFITQQSLGAPYSTESDDFKFTVTQRGNLRLRVYNIPVHDFGINLLNLNEQAVIRTIKSNSRGNIDTIINLNAGSYYLELFGYPNDYSYVYPYAFRADFTPNTATQDVDNAILTSKIYPNPVVDYATIRFNLPINSDVKIKIYNALGQEVKTLNLGNLLSGENNIELNTSDMNNGIYIYSIQTDKDLESKQFVIRR